MAKNKSLACVIGTMLLATPSFAEMCVDEFSKTTKIDDLRSNIEICMGFAAMLQTQDAFETVIVGDDAILNLSVISPQVLGLIGHSVGKTNIHLFGKAGRLISETNISVITYQPVASTTATADISGKTVLQTPVALVSQPQPKKEISRIVVNAGSAEILYDCAENCTKLDR